MTKHLTRGAMYELLEDLGEHVRGQPLTDRELARMLRDRGVDASHEPAPTSNEETTNER